VIRIDFVEPATEEWGRWRSQCAAKAQALIADGQPYRITDYYKNQRELLFAAFSFKCAYCECSLRPGQIGDVEHFRPKGAVADVNFNKVFLDARRRKPHPGYFWLAYDVTNLLPACQLCNEAGLGGGKRERFPLLDESTRARKPGDEKHERPALINPAAEDPAPHFVLCTATGTLGLVTERAEMCDKVFNLNREDLMRERRRAYATTRQNVKTLLNETLGDEQEYRRMIDELQRVKSGAAAYALACRQALRDSKPAIDRLFAALSDLVQ
jgi:hypothetical protein